MATKPEFRYDYNLNLDDEYFELNGEKYPTKIGWGRYSDPNIEPWMSKILENDDKIEFLKWVNNAPYNEDDEYRLLFNLFKNDAIECAKAILAGETGGRFDIKPKPFYSSIGNPPLPVAAYHGAYRITQLFLDYGEDANVIADYFYVDKLKDLKKVLPLNVALNKSCDYARYWDDPTTWESCVFQLICNLCRYEMLSYLRTIKLLAQHTKDQNQQISYYLKGGRIVEICVLMLSGCLQPVDVVSYVEDNDSTNHIGLPDFMKQLDEKWCNEHRTMWPKRFRLATQKELMMQLVEIFESIGPKLQAYVMIERSKESLSHERVVSEIGLLFKDGGLPVKRKQKTPMLNSSISFKEVNQAGMISYVQVVEIPEKIKFAISRDSIHEFTGEIIEFKYVLRDEEADYQCAMLELLKLICLHRADNCAAALIQHVNNTTISLDLDFAIEDGLGPLHIAAQSLRYSLTQLCLQYGAHPNTPSFDAHAKLPLELALEALSSEYYLKEWSPEKSLYNLFSGFLYLPRSGDVFSVIELLASRTETEQLEMICLQCVKNGQVVKVAALLVVAWVQLMGPYAYNAIQDYPIAKCILKELGKLDISQEHKIKLESTWLMLEVSVASLEILKDFHDCGLRKITGHYEITSRIAYWLSSEASLLDNALAMKPEYSFIPAIKPEDRDWLDQALQRKLAQRSFTEITNYEHIKKTMAPRVFRELTRTTKVVGKPQVFGSFSPMRLYARFRSAMRFK